MMITICLVVFAYLMGYFSSLAVNSLKSSVDDEKSLAMFPSEKYDEKPKHDEPKVFESHPAKVLKTRKVIAKKSASKKK